MSKLSKRTVGYILLAFGGLMLAGAILVYFFGMRNAAAPGEKRIGITVVHADESSKVFEVNTEAEYLGEALLEEGIAEGEVQQYGLYILTVDGETADEAAQQWWCVTKGGGEVLTGADSTPIADGDQFELTLKTGW